jgi:hypothetical protein
MGEPHQSCGNEVVDKNHVKAKRRVKGGKYEGLDFTEIDNNIRREHMRLHTKSVCYHLLEHLSNNAYQG